MADAKISALTAATVAAEANEIPINEAGTTKKITVAQLMNLLPRGRVASPSRATDVASTSTGVVDITDVTYTWTVPTGGRRFKATLTIPFLTSSAVAGTYVYGMIRNAADATLQYSVFRMPTAGYAFELTVMWEGNLAAGSQTLKGSMQQAAAGTITSNNGSGFITKLLIEDIGPTV